MPFVATLGSNLQLGATTDWVDVTGWDSPEIRSANFDFNPTTGVLTARNTGMYLLMYATTLDQYSGNNRTEGAVRVVKNGVEVKGMTQRGYHRQLTQGDSSYAASRLIVLLSGDEIKLQAANTSTTLIQQVVAGSTVLSAVLVS